MFQSTFFLPTEKALKKVFIGLSKDFTDPFLCTKLATYLEERDDFVEDFQRSKPDSRTNYPAIANGILKGWSRDVAAAGWSVEERLRKLQDVLADPEGRERLKLAKKCIFLWQVRN